MKTLCSLLASLIVAGGAFAQQAEDYDSKGFQQIQDFVGLTEAEIRARFGDPEEVGVNETKEAVVWTYVDRRMSEQGVEQEVIGYRQVAFWNGLVASVSTRWFADEPQVESIYRSALTFMGEDGRTIAYGSGFDRAIFTDSLRISRRTDNIWMVDMLRNESNSRATLLVGDAGYHMCRSAMELEARRIEDKFGLDVRELGVH